MISGLGFQFLHIPFLHIQLLSYKHQSYASALVSMVLEHGIRVPNVNLIQKILAEKKVDRGLMNFEKRQVPYVKINSGENFLEKVIFYLSEVSCLERHRRHL